MKFKHLAYSKDEEVFLFYTNDAINHIAKRIVGRKFSSKELRYLKQKAMAEIHNLIIKIDSSGIRQ